MQIFRVRKEIGVHMVHQEMWVTRELEAEILSYFHPSHHSVYVVS